MTIGDGFDRVYASVSGGNKLDQTVLFSNYHGGRPFAAAIGAAIYFALSTISSRRQRLVLDSGLVSIMETVSPILPVFSKS